MIVSSDQKKGENTMILKALGAPDWLKTGSVYQINPRTFSPEGTIASVTGELPFLAEHGIGTVYLCPIFAADPSENPDNWSIRQKASKTGNPKNPYRMKDYFAIDEEYGTMEDLAACARECHRLGMRLILDLVYLHIGPDADILHTHPEFAKQYPDGSFVNGRWNFPLLDFNHPGLREYLWSNMVYYVAVLDADGFRCDVGDGVPLDFWMEGHRRISAVKPDAILINEGTNPESLYAAFNAVYGFSWHSSIYGVLVDGKPASDLRRDWEETHNRNPGGSLILRDMDNHDTVTDWPGRVETLAGHDGMDLIITLNHTIDGIPMVYCGNELADEAVLSMFANRFHPGRFETTRRDDAAKNTPEARSRRGLVKQLNALRKEDIRFRDGKTVWIDHDRPDSVIAFSREYGGKKLWFIANTGRESVTVTLDGAIPADAEKTIVSGAEVKSETSLCLKGHGFILMRE